jgi:hypothetical protein
MDKLAVEVSSEMLQRSVMPPDLVVNNRLASDFKVVLDAPVEKEFFEMIALIMNEYIEKGKMPPEEIACAINNLVDDYTSKRNPVLRAGDYIALHSYFKKNQ